ncbi:MAG: SUMF1/EgtB/PvdO family nonheme iron enzyme [Candidatus Delongbacteria bacterium]|jgi:sulfatase modifying factor 1|nr:SUMF1/EgtB/PvdO family nonheme iron enzyme [Candidatus Delongbacteria bacterium]
MKKTILSISIIGIILALFLACSDERDHANPFDPEYWDNGVPVIDSIEISNLEIDIVKLEWDIAELPAGGKFWVDKRVDSLGWNIAYGWVSSNERSYLDSNAEINSNIDYRIKLVYGDVESDYALNNFKNVVKPPLNLIVKQNNIYTFSLSWEDENIGEDGFIVESKIDEGQYSEIGTTIETSYVDSTMSKKGYGTVYYQVKAHKDSCESDYTRQNSLVEFPSPSNLTIIQKNLYTVEICWLDSAIGEDKYEIERKVSEDSVFLKVGEIAGSDSLNKVWHDINLPLDINYDYRIYGVKGSNNSDSLVQNFDNIFEVPSELKYAVLDTNIIELMWTDNCVGEDGFKIDRKVGESGDWVIDFKTVEADVEMWIDNTYDPYIPYYYRIRAFYNGIESGYSSELFLSEMSLDMIYIEGVTFGMGDHYNECSVSELPVHNVTLSDFYMNKYEVTQIEWEKYMPPIIYNYGEEDNLPIYNISWYEAIVYCNKRSIDEGIVPCYLIKKSTNPDNWGDIPSLPDDDWNNVLCNWNEKGYRLPTEAEWEYAARGGINWTDDYRYSGCLNDVELTNYAWYDSNSSNLPHLIGLKFPNQLGIYDTSGNVHEWCWDWYGEYSSEPVTNPIGADSYTHRIIRGGQWNGDKQNCLVAERISTPPASGGSGIRVVRRR